MGDLLAGVVIALELLLFLGIALAFLACVAWVLTAVVALVRGRRPSTTYWRQFRAEERRRQRRHRRPPRRGTGSGITIFLDTRPPGVGKREP
jgi:hypothetical protein